MSSGLVSEIPGCFLFSNLTWHVIRAFVYVMMVALLRKGVGRFRIS